MKINFNTQNFNGYKNLIHTDMHSDNGRFVLFALQLDDNDGHQDLSYFKRLLRENSQPETDVLTLIMANDENKTPRLVLNNSALFSLSELKLLNKPIMQEHYSKQELKNFENFNVRAYTLLAKLTKRMMNISMVSTDSGIQHTIKEVSDLLKENFPNLGCVMGILNSAFFEKKHFQITAGEINRIIDDRMTKYLKIKK